MLVLEMLLKLPLLMMLELLLMMTKKCMWLLVILSMVQLLLQEMLALMMLLLTALPSQLMRYSSSLIYMTEHTSSLKHAQVAFTAIPAHHYSTPLLDIQANKYCHCCHSLDPPAAVTISA